MAVKIITDSASDLDPKELAKMGVDFLPMRVIFGNKEFLDSVNLTKKDFYKKLEKSDKLPSTAQVPPSDFISLYNKYPNDDFVGIFIASDLSGTYQSANIAKESASGREIYLCDSKTVTMGLALLVKFAVFLRDQGKSAKEIYEKLEEVKEKIKVVAIIDNLKYLSMGGRLSSAGMIIGSVLNIKPIIKVEDGKVITIGKARGLKKAHKEILKFIKSADIDLDSPISSGHSNAPEMLEDLAKLLKSEMNITADLTFEIGATVGTHAGPGCVGFGFFTK